MIVLVNLSAFGSFYNVKRNETRRTVCVCDVRPEVLLQVGVLVVVDAHEPVTRPLSQVLHEARLTARRGTLQ